MNYITKVIDTLRMDEFYGASENIEIAKGKFQIVRNWKSFMGHCRHVVRVHEEGRIPKGYRSL